MRRRSDDDLTKCTLSNADDAFGRNAARAFTLNPLNLARCCLFTSINFISFLCSFAPCSSRLENMLGCCNCQLQQLPFQRRVFVADSRTVDTSSAGIGPRQVPNRVIPCRHLHAHAKAPSKTHHVLCFVADVFPPFTASSRKNQV